MNKIIYIALGCSLFLSACNSSQEFSPKQSISVISREQGSGTRDAFTELTEIKVKQNGQKKDLTTIDALVIDGTQAVMSNVAGNEYAIGYISLGSLNNTVKGISVENVPVNVENIKNGSYKIARPFNVAYKNTSKPLLQDFLSFIMSQEGSMIIEKSGFISVAQEATSYKGKNLSGKLVIAGSSSVSPVMEKLKEAYIKNNPNVTIELQTNDSSSGMIAAQTGSCDLGMASRNLKDTEKDALQFMTIAMDGIAIIVNQKNPTNNLKISEIKEIFTGNAKTWEAFLE